MMQFNALENRIKRHESALVASGLYEEPVDPTLASQVMWLPSKLPLFPFIFIGQ